MSGLSTWQRLVGFAIAAGVAFALAIGVGRLVGPIESAADDHGHDDRATVDPVDGDEHDEHLTLALERSVYDAGRQSLAFTIRDGDGEPVTAYDVAHEKLLHLVVVRRDLGGFRHVHPTLDAATGRWTTPLDLDAGTWRVYADFTPTGGDASLAEAEVSVAGDYAPAAQPVASDTSRVDGYEVHLTREGAALALHVTRDGNPVTDLEPYLGAYGHLVAIRAEDMTYLHVHPQDGPAGPEVAFHAEFAQAGNYRLFFEFSHGGSVHRAEFTVDVDAAPAPGGHGGHGDDSGQEEKSDEHAH